MQDLFELTPELLLEQSQEMFSLCSAYENLFTNISSDLNGINGSWSDLLSNNFSGKIGSAQKAFSGALSMLQNSANSARSVAETAQEMDTSWASKIGGSMFNPDILSAFLAEGMLGTLKEGYRDASDAMKAITDLKEKLEGKLTSSQKAWLEEIEKKLLGKDSIKALKITEKILEGDYSGAVKDGTKAVIGGMLSKLDKDLGKYYLNLGWDVGTAGGELVMDPSWKNVGNLAWNSTVQPVLDTAGSTMEDVIKLIPGISEFYFDENGAEDIGGAAGVALGEFYSLFTPDEGIKEYAANYYKDGVWEGLWGGFEDINSFVKDSGGVTEAAKSFFETAWNDNKENMAYVTENAEYLWKAVTGLFGGSEKPVNIPLDSTSL